ncbi:MAG: FG-GAP-like repeat-containing protein [bacterium]
MNTQAKKLIVATITRTEIVSTRVIPFSIVIGFSSVALTLMLSLAANMPFINNELISAQYDDSNSIKLTWTAPGDDGHMGQASEYEIRYAISEITNQNWSEATRLSNPPEPRISGSAESVRVFDLEPDTEYFFAIKSMDEAGNISYISNVAHKTTACLEDWSCEDWSDCLDGIHTRICTDQNSCGTDQNMPIQQEYCDFGGPSPDCEESWSCTTWSECRDEGQYRFCMDDNGCGTDQDRPDELQSCEVANQPENIVVGTHPGYPPHLRVMNKDGEVQNQFYAYSPQFTNGVNFTRGDVNGDGEKEIITGTNGRSAPHIRVLKEDGTVVSQFYAYPAQWRIGVQVAVGDINADGTDEIIVLPAVKSAAHVRVFDFQGNLQGQFYVFPAHWRLLLNIDSGDLNGDLRDDIIVATTEGYTPHVRIFSGQGQLISQFFAYALNYRGGVEIAVGDTNGDNIDEIVTGAGQGYHPHVRILTKDGDVVGQFYAYALSYQGGVTLSTADVDGDGKDEVVVGTRPGASAHVRIFKNTGDLVSQFFAYPEYWRIGVEL